jgi:hypothetical protein
MRCKKTKRYFSEYLLGDISPSDRVILEDHLDSCDACKESLAAYRKLFDAISDSPIGGTSDLYFDVLPHKILEKIHFAEVPSRGSLFSLQRFWWKPVSVFATAVLIVLVSFSIYSGPGRTITSPGALPDFANIEQAESYPEFLSSFEDTDEPLVLEQLDTSISGTSDNDVWYSNIDTVDEILLFSDEEQEEIFDEIKDRLS